MPSEGKNALLPASALARDRNVIEGGVTYFAF